MIARKILTLEDIVAEECGMLHLGIVMLRQDVEKQKEKIATLEMEIANLKKTAEAPTP